MRLSVIIVSYNVRYFLEQCLASVRAASRGALAGETEVIIVDNASQDGTIDFLRPLFPDFRFVPGTENLGFARANNLALGMARGEYVLFLNPDTILPEDALQRAVAFFNGNPKAGAAGVHMIDGRGRFLKESKRGFPGPAASFFKMTGLAALFPRSRFFAGYYAGHTAADQVQEADILSGACMFVRREAIRGTGGFDERFFMYAEDIDLSWRIRQAGHLNYYLGDISIIHFKGKSTHRDLRYVRQFYKAMHQFRDKYGGHRGPGEWVLRAGIGLREMASSAGVIFRGSGRGHEKEPVSGYVLLGEPAQPEAMTAALREAGLKENTGSAAPDLVVFCQGPDLSWKNIIAAISGESPERHCLIHGQGTHAIVGSGSGEQPGRVIFLNR